MKHAFFSKLLSLAACVLLLLSTNQAMAEPKVVVELFTSQGCSSCPPADKVIAELAKDKNLVVITRNVTYWDDLGWKDTLAYPEQDTLQYAYAANQDSRRVYTPQVIINGEVALVGSQKRKIRKAIKAVMPSKARISTSVENGKTVLLLDGDIQKTAEVRLLKLIKSVAVDVKKGENRNRLLHYTNSVQSEEVLGYWKGGAHRVELPARASLDEGEQWAVVVQVPYAREVLSAVYVN